MTDDKLLLKSTVDSYTTGGTTAGHLGTAFAWYLLSPEWASIWPASSEPSAYGDGNTTTVAILMTGGEYNTVGGSMSGGNVTKSAKAARDTCKEMKAQGIIVYTAGFKLNAATAQATLEDPAHGLVGRAAECRGGAIAAELGIGGEDVQLVPRSHHNGSPSGWWWLALTPPLCRPGGSLRWSGSVEGWGLLGGHRWGLCHGHSQPLHARSSR